MLPKKIIAVPTNIITGFLGVGKTSAMLHLLKNKPEEERWAVLVNEFGEIGIDGSLMAGEYSEQHGVYIQEVPGGCMCCAAGVSMQVALNQLLKRAKPDRLLIEPTGLGHPKEVLKVLSAEHYQTALALQKTITLVDARNLSDQRYTTHNTFNQQIAIADTVIGNKVDMYQNGDKEKLIHYVKTHGQSNANVYFSQQGDIALSQLAGAAVLGLSSKYHRHTTTKVLISSLPMPECGFIKAMNTGEGFSSIGWRFSSDKVFNQRKLQAFLISVTAERIKAAFITELGTFAYNVTTDDFTKKRLSDSKESRIEIISQHLDDSLETQLMACIIY
jgi:G3E family GTPase